MSLGRSAESWQGTPSAVVTGTNYRFHMAFSNIDQMAPDGLHGDTELGIEVRLLR